MSEKRSVEQLNPFYEPLPKRSATPSSSTTPNGSLIATASRTDNSESSFHGAPTSPSGFIGASKKVSVLSLLNSSNKKLSATPPPLSSAIIATMTPDSHKTADVIEIDDQSEEYDDFSQEEVGEKENDENLDMDNDDDDGDMFASSSDENGYMEDDDDGYDDDEDENIDEDEEDDDDYGESQGLGDDVYSHENTSKQNDPLYIPYSSYESKDIRDIQIQEETRVSNIIAVVPDQVEALLRHFKWNGDNLIEKYVDRPAKALSDAGVPSDPKNSSIPIFNAPFNPQPASDSFVCCVCFDSKADYARENPDCKQGMMTFSMECNHLVCLDCYRTYAKGKIMDEGISESLTCPIPKCTIRVNRPAIKALFRDTDPEVEEKYSQYMLNEYIRIVDKFTFCPAPDCNYIVECPVIKRIDPERQVPRVKCRCGNAFCFHCNNTDHRPATCKITSLWLQRCRDDSETANWIRANTQECPKCHSTIEKNGGCNHMNCKQCRYEFCWVCLGTWASHGNQYYNCSRYNEDDSKEARSGQEQSRSELNRYLHYYNRFRNHQQSLALDSETFAAMQSKMRELQDSKGMSWIEVQFLSQAFDVLRKSRQTLTWTYAFAFYLQKTHESMIFENNQADLELSVEQLSELFEKPATDLASLKVKLLDKSKYVATRRVVMLEHAANGLRDGAWKYQPDLIKPKSSE